MDMIKVLDRQVRFKGEQVTIDAIRKNARKESEQFERQSTRRQTQARTRQRRKQDMEELQRKSVRKSIADFNPKSLDVTGCKSISENPNGMIGMRKFPWEHGAAKESNKGCGGGNYSHSIFLRERAAGLGCPEGWRGPASRALMDPEFLARAIAKRPPKVSS